MYAGAGRGAGRWRGSVSGDAERMGGGGAVKQPVWRTIIVLEHTCATQLPYVWLGRTMWKEPLRAGVDSNGAI